MKKTDKPVKPAVGMGCTINHYSDRDPATVIRVVSARCVEIQEDRYDRLDSNGMSESQAYEYSPDPCGVRHLVTLRKTGLWRLPGKTGSVVHFGHRRCYYDYSF